MAETMLEKRFSEWIESMRKDVECTFGILKGRWRILKTGIRVHGLKNADKTWMTCCALHNWLLHVDGLDEKWESGVPSCYEGEMGSIQADDIPFAIRRLNDDGGDVVEQQWSNVDHTGMGRGDDQSNEVQPVAIDPNEGTSIEEATENGVRIVRKLTLRYFKKKLVEHFGILRLQGKLKWPKRLNDSKPKEA
jgi:hypothetical protein